MKQIPAYKIELAASELRRCKTMNEFFYETVSNNFGSHPYCEILQVIIEYQDSILMAAIDELTGEKGQDDEAGSAE